MKKSRLFLGGLLLLAACKSAPAPQAQAPTTQQMQQMMQPPANCSNLTPDEQNFSYQLTNPNNQSMFCSQFTPDQRMQAMQMAGQPMAGGNTMSPDQAVQQVMKNNRMAPMSAPTNQNGNNGYSNTNGGACPVK